MIPKKAKIYVSGHAGMVGHAFTCFLKKRGFKNLLLRNSRELDLRNPKDTERFFKSERPAYVFHFAARVGGIKANMSRPADFLYDNLMIDTNVIHFSHLCGVKKLLYLGSSCIYPRLSPQPMKEEYLLTGKLEPTNEGYALAKICGLKLCESYKRQYGANFLCLMPSNLYGPYDNFDPGTSHVIPALIKKFLEAKDAQTPYVEVWGTGRARREFLYIDDLAGACFYFMNTFDAAQLPSFVNVGSGQDVTVKEMAHIIKRQTKYKGKITWNRSMPDGMPRKLLDSRLASKFGWKARTSLEAGIRKAIAWYEKGRFAESQRT